ncbi:MAG: flippase-like domain-containing protein [Myxococcales bacterium]|nr:flippase-like domain-containing protein [Myxococcales bacterium]
MTPGARHLILFGCSFLALTIGGVAVALWRAPIGWHELAAVAELAPAAIAVVVAGTLATYLADVVRYRAVGRAIAVTVPWRAALDTSVANFFFSWLTPGSTFGVPATIYMLGRRGVPWDATVAIAFAKAFTGVAVLVVVALAMVALGLGPRYDGRLVATVVFGGAVFTALCAALVLAAVRPRPAQRVVARVFGWLGRRARGAHWVEAAERVTHDAVDRLARLRTGGAAPLARLALAHVAFFGATTAAGVALMTAFGGAVDVATVCAVVVYLAFTYLAPTPGGAGFAEAMAVPFFGPLVADGQAVAFVLCFRGLTLYVQIVFAAPYMLIVGGVGEILARAARRRSPDG